MYPAVFIILSKISIIIIPHYENADSNKNSLKRIPKLEKLGPFNEGNLQITKLHQEKDGLKDQADVSRRSPLNDSPPERNVESDGEGEADTLKDCWGQASLHIYHKPSIES